jgi:hypothetical protein
LKANVIIYNNSESKTSPSPIERIKLADGGGHGGREKREEWPIFM